MQFEDGMVEMSVGDFINMPAFRKYRVDWTTPDEPANWLGVRYHGDTHSQYPWDLCHPWSKNDVEK
jgi:hypothetical protein